MSWVSDEAAAAAAAAAAADGAKVKRGKFEAVYCCCCLPADVAYEVFHFFKLLLAIFNKTTLSHKHNFSVFFV